MSTTEGNKLIAEFMGAEMIAPIGHTMRGVKFPKETHGLWVHAASDLHYHTSWDWLMPVVEKIEKQFHESVIFRINDSRASIDIDTQAAMAYDIDLVPDCYSGYCETKIEAVYKTVIQFIKLYNQNKTS